MRFHRLHEAGQPEPASDQADSGQRAVRILHAHRRDLLRKPVARAQYEAVAEAEQVRRSDPQQHARSAEEQSGDGDVAGRIAKIPINRSRSR